MILLLKLKRQIASELVTSKIILVRMYEKATVSLPQVHVACCELLKIWTHLHEKRSSCSMPVACGSNWLRKRTRYYHTTMPTKLIVLRVWSILLLESLPPGSFVREDMDARAYVWILRCNQVTRLATKWNSGLSFCKLFASFCIFYLTCWWSGVSSSREQRGNRIPNLGPPPSKLRAWLVLYLSKKILSH